MAADKGRDFLLKISDGLSPGTFTTVAGVRSRTFTINNEAVDITDSDTAPFRALLTGAGIKQVSFSGSGIFKDDAAINAIEDLAADVDSNEQEYQIVMPNGDIWQGVFHLSSFEYTGEFNGARQYNISLENAGAVTLIRA